MLRLAVQALPAVVSQNDAVCRALSGLLRLVVVCNAQSRYHGLAWLSLNAHKMHENGDDCLSMLVLWRNLADLGLEVVTQ